MTDAGEQPEIEKIEPYRQATAAILLALVLMGMAGSLILLGYRGHRGGTDQTQFHLVVIQGFSRQWPHFDFSDYVSATTPGYHLAIAAVDHFVTHNVRGLRWAGMCFGLGLSATLAAAVARHLGAARAVLLCLPFVCSMYVISSAAWLSPDNAGWWGVLVLLLIALRRADAWTYPATALAFLALVLIRQSHLWIMAPLLVAAWIGNGSSVAAGEKLAPRLGRVAIMVLCLLPGLAALGWFIRLWHGPLPPNQARIVGGINPSAPALALATTGALGAFFLPLLFHRVSSWGRAARWAGLGAATALLVAAIAPTTFSVAAGRYSGLWNLTPRRLVFHNHSGLIIGLATLGGMLLGAWLSLLRERDRWIWGATIVAFGAAQIASYKAFQRYDEPMILLAAALGTAPLIRRPAAAAWAGPILLSLLLLTAAFLSI